MAILHAVAFDGIASGVCLLRSLRCLDSFSRSKLANETTGFLLRAGAGSSGLLKTLIKMI